MRFGPLHLTVVTLVAFSSDLDAQVRRSYPTQRLSLTIPVGFETFRPEGASPAVLDTFRRAPQGGRGPVVIQLLLLGAELPQRPLNAEERRAFTLGAPFALTDHPATALALAHRVPTSAGRGRTPSGAPVFRLAALLPMRDHAVQLSVLARGEDEADARRIFASLLRSAEGPVSWQTRAQRTAFALATGAFAVAIFGTLVIVVRVLLQGSVSHLGPVAQRRIAWVTGAAWAVFALWLLLPLRSAEWTAAVPAGALAVTFIARAARRSG